MGHVAVVGENRNLYDNHWRSGCLKQNSPASVGRAIRHHSRGVYVAAHLRGARAAPVSVGSPHGALGGRSGVVVEGTLCFKHK